MIQPKPAIVTIMDNTILVVEDEPDLRIASWNGMNPPDHPRPRGRVFIEISSGFNNATPYSVP